MSLRFVCERDVWDKINFQISDESDLTTVLETMRCFLLGCGYHLSGDLLTIVNEGDCILSNKEYESLDDERSFAEWVRDNHSEVVSKYEKYLKEEGMI